MRVRIIVVGGPDLGRSFTFEQGDTPIIGSGGDAGICLAGDPSVAPYEYALAIGNTSLTLFDLAKQDGSGISIANGERLCVGASVLQVEVEQEAAMTSTTALPDTVLDPRGGAAVSGSALVREVSCAWCLAKVSMMNAYALDDTVVFLCDACRAMFTKKMPLIPGYRVEKELGRGGMGRVLLATELRSNKLCAVKQILISAAASQRGRMLFENEAVCHSRLKHKNIVEFYAFREVVPGMFCIIMEYVPGTNAASLVAERGRLEWRLAAHVIAQVLEGIEEAHAHGIIHRDIKPENILLELEGDSAASVKLADFGIAKALANAGLLKPTVTGEQKGTLAYMPPEQARDSKRVGFTADIYSIGATLYTLLTGKFARDFPDDTAPLLVVMENKVIPITERDPAVPRWLAAVVEKALRTSPAQRYQSAREMRDELP